VLLAVDLKLLWMGPSKPREGKADRDKEYVVRPGREQKRCPDILGKGGEGLEA
jgi:hypothetical protein